jgi:hypothetical protein
MATAKTEAISQYLMDILNQRLASQAFQMPITKGYTADNRVFLAVNADGSNDAYIVIEQQAMPASGLFDGIGQAQRQYSPHIIRVGFEQGAAASGTVTAATVVATNTLTINGVVFTAVAAGAVGNQFNVGGNDTVTAANIAAAINASVTAGVQGVVTATSALAVVTITAVQPGLTGNAISLASSGATLTVSGAKLTGGTNTAIPDAVRAIVLSEVVKVGTEVRVYQDAVLTIAAPSDLDDDTKLVTVLRDLRFGMLAHV